MPVDALRPTAGHAAENGAGFAPVLGPPEGTDVDITDTQDPGLGPEPLVIIAVLLDSHIEAGLEILPGDLENPLPYHPRKNPLLTLSVRRKNRFHQRMRKREMPPKTS